MKDLHTLPKFRDNMSFLYVEHAKIEQHEKAIAVYDADGLTPVPAASLAVLMLGPGTTITHAAVRALADNNCLAVWCGEENVRFYAAGMGGTRSAARLLHQAQQAADEAARIEVAKRMYRFRFDEPLPEDAGIEQLRGMEGARVRKAYADLSKQYGVPWSGRAYERGDWAAADPVNRALSAGNSCLYGLCHAAILSAGYSPAIGFIHTGKQRSFVYDIADLYKTDIVFPVAFRTAADAPQQVGRTVRLALRDRFREERLVRRILPDIVALLGGRLDDSESVFDGDPALPADLWTPPGQTPDHEM